MERKELKKPSEFLVGDVIDTCFGYTQTILELVEIEEEKWNTTKKYVFKISNNFSENVYLHKFSSSMPHIIIGNVANKVENILSSKPFKKYS